jgi:hypothetical protein
MCKVDHAAVKADPAAWAALELVGHQRIEGEPVLELRLCSECRTTLAIEIDPPEEAA